MQSIDGVPLLFIIFNRPDVTERVFEVIAKAKPRQLFVAADGPRVGREGEAAICQATRRIVEQIDWDCEVKTLFRKTNLGCKQAVSSAIDWFFEHVEAGVILEDDCLPSDSFFPFCAELLERYREDDRVMMITGNNFQDGVSRGDASYYFSSVPWIWGWATWRRAWQLYDREMQTFPTFVKEGHMQSLFSDLAVQNYYWSRFIPTYEGKINTWDYQWIYSILTQKGLSICPHVNLVSNIGFDSQATHTRNQTSKFSSVPTGEIDEICHPRIVSPNRAADAYFYDQYLDVYFSKIKNGLRRWHRVWWRNKKYKKWLVRLMKEFSEGREVC